MIIENLQITDFRVFQGRHNIDLAPRTKYNKKRPIVLFGGLNGAGKTTILTAIRLGLFGKQALGYNTSQKVYEEFLAACIHRAKDQFLQAFASNIEIQFTYANMGVLKHYKVKREWMLSNKRITERLTLNEDGKDLSELTNEQCQGFLNELIPMGVADLFFFDGEKIAELAEDTGGSILGNAIKKLLGLDLLDTLHGDLNVITRNKSKDTAPAQIQKDIEQLEGQLEELDQTIDAEHSAFEQTLPAIQEAEKNIDQLENELKAKGGSWASTREQETKRLAELEANIEMLAINLREAISDSYPFAIAGKYAKHVLKQLKAEQQYKAKQGTASLIQSHLDNLQKAVQYCLSAEDAHKISDLLVQEFKTSIEPASGVQVIHDISDSSLTTIEAAINDACNKKNSYVIETGKELKTLREKHESASRNIARAPVEDVLQPIFDQIKAQEEKKTTHIKMKTLHLEKCKAALRDAMSITRKLEKLTEQVNSEGEALHTINFANNTKSLLKDFSEAVTKQKITQLEQAFVDSFSRLARKGDMTLKARIDHKSFSVQLLSKDERLIDKNELSAGEKQIYAISILEALAKTSGRLLPIIIDTPLGRLDSVHRTHLVNQYFPNASHQVVILSTDTEVDEHFYSDLSNHISHAYQLDYSPETNSTTAEEGYFWKQSKQTEVEFHAA